MLAACFLPDKLTNKYISNISPHYIQYIPCDVPFIFRFFNFCWLNIKSSEEIYFTITLLVMVPLAVIVHSPATLAEYCRLFNSREDIFQISLLAMDVGWILLEISRRDIFQISLLAMVSLAVVVHSPATLAEYCWKLAEKIYFKYLCLQWFH